MNLFGRWWQKDKSNNGGGAESLTMIDSGMTLRAEITQSGESRRLSSARDLPGGVDLRLLGPGAVVEARTKNSVYTVRLEEGGGISLAGHPDHCPEMTPVVSVGSVLTTGEICDGYLAPGMRMEFRLGGRRVFTSRLGEVRVVR